MYPGRDKQVKSALLQRISSVVSKYTEVDMKDINCCIVEIPPENWYGGMK
jgi:phenylpyruvate tautomerase PptA (4-oxalocrotonate tautomerase family)